MSASNAAALAIAGVIALGFVALIYRAGRSIEQANTTCEQILADTLPEPEPAVLDTEPGINLNLRDECDRIMATPSPFDEAGAERLRAAIRDEQQKGETA